MLAAGQERGTQFSRLYIPVLSGFLAFPLWADTGAAAAPRALDLSAAAEERSAYGLAVDLDVVRDIVSSGRDVGSSKWRVVLTADEETSLDLPDRMQFAKTTHNAHLVLHRCLAAAVEERLIARSPHSPARCQDSIQLKSSQTGDTAFT